MYPANVIRRVNLVKGMMAENLTIEEIQRSFIRFKEEIDGIETSLRDLIGNFEREAKGQAPTLDRRPSQASWRRRSWMPSAPPASWSAASPAWRRRLSNRGADAPGTAVGGGSDLF